jgi:hypothetical protein
MAKRKRVSDRRRDNAALRAQALTLAVQNRELMDTASGDAQIKRAKRYLAFLNSNRRSS